MYSINNKMISSVPIHHNSFANELLWRTHYPVKQESLDDSGAQVSPEIFADTEIIDTDSDLDQLKSRSDHLARFIPPTISTSPTIPAHQGIYVSPTYQQRDLSTHFRSSPNRMSPYSIRGSPNLGHHKTSPTSILSSSPSSLYHQKISPSGYDIYQSSTPDKFRASPIRHSDLYQTSPSISAEFHHISPTSHTSGVSSHFSSDHFQSPQSYSHLPSSIGVGQFPNDIYRSLNFNLPKTSDDAQLLSPHLSSTDHDEPLNMNSKQLDLSQVNQRLSPYSNLDRSLSSPRNSPPNFNDRHPVNLINVSPENHCSTPSNHESHGSNHDSRSPSPILNSKPGLKQATAETPWSASTEASAPAIECTNDIPSLKCYFCSYNTKSRIQLNKHMRDAHNESKIMPFQNNKESTNESEDDNENETHSNLSEDFMMDEYDEEDAESEDFAVNISKVSQNANNNKRTNYKCKKCILTFKDKDEYYIHQKDNHIKREKLLECKLCSFVTEYKHHHEYHIKNHFKMKPFKCSYSNCKYSCNNQSMLNSHVKSHKSFYQFHCKNCNYATKYMHSFKLHLRKNNHEKGITLNEDGSVNNDIIIDIHGTRRGPKRKSRKLDDVALQNINNNNCITETIKKTIHHEPESEYNNNVTMSSNNGSSRSNSPLSSANYNNNNNNDSYYLNTKLFVYSHMTSMMNDKTPEIWPKKFAKTNHSNVPEVVDLSESVEEPKEMQVDVDAPLDLSKNVETKPQHIAEAIQKVHAPTSNEVSHTPTTNTPRPQGNQKLASDSKQALIKIENKVKTSADMIRIVGKNNFNLSNGNILKNKNRIKLCKNVEKSIKNAIEKGIKSEIEPTTTNTMSNNGDAAKGDHVDTVVENTCNISPKEMREAGIDIEICDKLETIDALANDEIISNKTSSVEILQEAEKKTSTEDINAISEANQKVISSNKNRRRKGKAYKLQINSHDYIDNVDDEFNVDEEPHKDEESISHSGQIKISVDRTKHVTEEDKESTPPSTFEAIQMDYLKQIQNQYFKTFQQNKCLENCAVPPSHHNSILSNMNNNINSSQQFDCKSQLLSSYQQTAGDLVGSHLKNLERINSHLLQNSLNMRQKSEGLKSLDNILSKKVEAQNNLLNFFNKRNEMPRNVNNNRLWYKCELCDIQYLDELIYSIHMRYHNMEHPYKCNLCGLQTNNKFQFNLHIIQAPH